MSRILFFSPYAAVLKHSLVETYFASQLRRHGHSILHMGCDKLLKPFCIAHSACGLVENSQDQHKADVCTNCCIAREDFERQYNSNFLINSYFQANDEMIAQNVVEQYLHEDDPYVLRYKDFPVGRIAAYEFILNHKILDMKNLDDSMRNIYIDCYLKNTIKMLVWAERFLQDIQPDKIFLYNPEYSLNHAIRLIGETMNIPTFFIHGGPHRGKLYSSIVLGWKRSHEASIFERDFFTSHRSCIPFDYSQYRYPLTHLKEIYEAKSNWTYSARKSNCLPDRYRDIKATGKKIVLASMSSPDEAYAASFSYFDTYFSKELCVFDNQYSWLQSMIAYFSKHLEYILIIRPHPREYPNKRETVKSVSSSIIERILSNSLPENIIANYPEEKVAIGDLFQIIDLHLVATSTVSLESGILGIPTISYIPRMQPFVMNMVPQNEAHYYEMIEKILNSGCIPDNDQMKKTFEWYLFTQHLTTINWDADFWNTEKRTQFIEIYKKQYGNPKSLYDVFEKHMNVALDQMALFFRCFEEKKELCELLPLRHTPLDQSELINNSKYYLMYLKELFRINSGIVLHENQMIFEHESEECANNSVVINFTNDDTIEVKPNQSKIAVLEIPRNNKILYSLSNALIHASSQYRQYEAEKKTAVKCNSVASFGRRKKSEFHSLGISDINLCVKKARIAFHDRDYRLSFDLYEDLIAKFPQYTIPVLSEAYQLFAHLPSQDRFTLYQSRYFEFGIEPSDKVLDIGSGHLPFPLATHLGEFAIDDASYGRAGQPFKYVEGKPVIQCNVEEMPFADKEFDFVYCSHVLEHVTSPERACCELMRVGKRGYIEVPKRHTDLWFNTAKLSNHKWTIELINEVLVFREYSVDEIEGLQCNLLLDMNCNPQTEREKALAALMNLKADQIYTMLLWKDSFHFEVRRGSY